MSHDAKKNATSIRKFPLPEITINLLKRMPKVQALLMLLLLLTAIPLTITLVKQRQDIRQRAAGETINTLDYFLTHHPDKSLTGTHPLSQFVSGNNVYYVKWPTDGELTPATKSFEAYRYDANFIYLVEDHSTLPFSPYSFTNGTWMKTSMQVGESIQMPADNIIQNFDNACGQIASQPNVLSSGQPFRATMVLESHSTIDFGGDIGPQDTIVLRYDFGNNNYEKFYYSHEWGWVKWESYTAGNVTNTSLFNKIYTHPAHIPNCAVACTPSFQSCPAPTATTGPTATTAPTGSITPTVSVTPVTTAGTVGYVAASCAYVGGWTCDPSNASTALKAQVYVDGYATASGTLLKEIPADQKSGDPAYDQSIANACGGNPSHQFYFDLPTSLKDGQEHKIYAYGITPDGLSKVPLIPPTASATTFTCSNITPTVTTTVTPTGTGNGLLTCSADKTALIPGEKTHGRAAATFTGIDGATGNTNAAQICLKVDDETSPSLYAQSGSGTITGPELDIFSPHTYAFTLTNQHNGADEMCKGTVIDSCSITTVVGTPTPSGDLTPGGGSNTKLALNLFLQGIGNGGDNANKTATGNDPSRSTRTVSIAITTDSGQSLAIANGMVTYDTSSKTFKGTVALDKDRSDIGDTIKITVPGYLTKKVTGISFTLGQTTTVPDTSLVTGDIVSDNHLDILDYNALLDCYSDTLPAKNCTDEKRTAADLNDDGKVNQYDYNLFIRELPVQAGD